MTSVRRSFKSRSAENRNSNGVSGEGLSLGVGVAVSLGVGVGVGVGEALVDAVASGSEVLVEESDADEAIAINAIPIRIAALVFALRVMNLLQRFLIMSAGTNLYEVFD